MSTNEVVIASAVRTAVGTFLGQLTDISPVKLGSTVVVEALRRAGIKPEEVDELFFGNVLSAK